MQLFEAGTPVNMQKKNDIRAEVRRAKRACSPEELARKSAAIIESVVRRPVFQRASTVLLYHSLPDEPDTHTLLRDWCRRKRLLLPVVCGSVLALRLYSPETPMTEGAFHISEPAGQDFTDFSSIDLALIPGVAFDAGGHRLGRGGGYYDRLLSHPAFRPVYKVGLCFGFQYYAELPTEPHDVAVDEVVYA